MKDLCGKSILCFNCVETIGVLHTIFFIFKLYANDYI